MSKNKIDQDQHSPAANYHIDLKDRARREMIANGLLTEFEPAIEAQIQKEAGNNKPQTSDAQNSRRDLRSLLWSSIDNPDSQDLDQIEYAEQLSGKNIRLMIGIADVDSLAPLGSAIDKHAYINTTSVYTGIVVFPMLPDELSFNLTSLLQDVDRQAIVIDLTIDEKGAVLKSDIYPALVRNKAKLDYKTVGDWLAASGDAPDKIAGVPGLVDQLLLQNEAKARIYELRSQQGSLHLHTLEANAVAVNGQVVDLEEVEENPARDLIENFMIAGNIAVSVFLEGKKVPSIRRVVKTPEKWPRIVEVAAGYGEKLPATPSAKELASFLFRRKKADPERFADLSLTIVKLLGRGEYVVAVPGQVDIGHFALAVHNYTHSTAPNRRYPDLVMQRLLKSIMSGAPSPYSLNQLNDIAIQCTKQEDAANKVERTMRKVAAAVLLSKHIGESFDGIVTGVKPDATYARIFKPPVEGRVIAGEKGLSIGDKVSLRLISTDPERAFIDFERAYDRHK